MSGAAAPLEASPVLLDAAGVRRATVRLAHEIAERHPGLHDVVLVGVRTRGIPLAARLGHELHAIEHVLPPLAALDARGYRDDRPRIDALRGTALSGVEGQALPPVDGTMVVLVDDVLFTGRTIRAALDALMDHGRPTAVEVLALVDRGHRELPVRATYVGKNVPTSVNDRVMVRLREVDGVDGAWLTRMATR